MFIVRCNRRVLVIYPCLLFENSSTVPGMIIIQEAGVRMRSDHINQERRAKERESPACTNGQGKYPHFHHWRQQANANNVFPQSFDGDSVHEVAGFFRTQPVRSVNVVSNTTLCNQ